MRYEGLVYRPPSEGFSLIIQGTIGCSHNNCSFCDMYRDKNFRMRSVEEVIEDLVMARKSYDYVDKIFIADGDALIIPTDRLIIILDKIRELFEECKKVSVYASPKSIDIKSVDELKLLKSKGLDMVYLGVESGDDEILVEINKGVNSDKLIECGKKIKDAKIKLSCTLISGLGGKEKWEQHAKNSARVLSSIDPDYLGLLTLSTPKGTPIYDEVNSGKLTILKPNEVIEETYELVKGLELTRCVFRSNHASNYINFGATLGNEKEKLLKDIENVLGGKGNYKAENLRGF